MSDIIQLLPDSVANQIAAGEVIQRPASVLKELVENSIDAKATHIQIIVKDAGRTLMQIIDNGVGMSPTDARMAFDRHATSKIRNANDLFGLTTMGFRGEALASIASVAQVELRTRRAEDEVGTMIEIAGSKVFEQKAEQCPVGSNFAIKNLFFNVPARRRFLKKNPTELKYILTEFYRIALVNPQVSFDFISDGEELFELPTATTKQRIDAIFGKISKKNFSQQLLTVETQNEIINIKGYIGKPEFAQKKAYQYFFVNGRYMQHFYFHKAITTAYAGMIQDANPNYFLYFDIDPKEIDVNIHPTKTEIKFADEQMIWSILLAALKETLGKFNVGPSIDFDQEGAVSIPTLNKNDLSDIRPPQTIFNPSYNPFNNSARGGNYRREKMDWEKLYENFEQKGDSKPIEQQPAEIAFVETEPTTNKENILPREVKSFTSDFFQFHGKYILTPVKSGIMLIDQQRASARILYERYYKQLSLQQGVSQQLLFPEVLEMSVEDTMLLEELLPDLRAVGFDMEKFGKQAFAVNGIPADLNNTNIAQIINDILFEAKSKPTNIQENWRQSIAESLAKAGAIKAGQVLNQEEITQMIESLFAIPEHAYSPDGKATMMILTQDEIEKRMR